MTTKNSTPREKHFLRVNGCVHINYIEAKHGEKDFVKILKGKIPEGLFATVMNNEDRYSSISSVVICIYGEMNTTNDIKWFNAWASGFVNALEAPTESAVFDVTITSTDGEDQHFVYAFSLEDGKLHSYKKSK